MSLFPVFQSNDNMDMMTKLTSEQHIAKELAERLSHQEDELKDIREQLAQKDGQLKEMIDKSAFEEDVEGYTQDQLEDRMRHLEAKSQLVETLQKELNHSQVCWKQWVLANEMWLLLLHWSYMTFALTCWYDSSACLTELYCAIAYHAVKVHLEVFAKECGIFFNHCCRYNSFLLHIEAWTKWLRYFG